MALFKKKKKPIEEFETKRFSKQEIIAMDLGTWRTFTMAIETKSYRLIGIPWKEWVRFYEDPQTSDLVFEFK